MESSDAMGLPPPSGAAGVMVGSGSLGTMLQRSISSAISLSSGLHAPAAVRPAITVSPNTTNQYPYPSEASPAFMAHPMPVNMSVGMAIDPAGTPRSEPLKRKRGRPRKYGPDGSMALALAPLSSPTTPGTPSQKRGRGRPPGSGRKQQLAALGGWLAGSAGVGFTPHVITIAAGEDVAMRIMSFSQQGPRAICILSANGAISNVTLRQPAISGGTVTYEGRFEILSLSGSFLLTETGGTRSRTGGLSVSLAGPDGRVVGGGVAGLLMAASPVQVVVGSFLSNGKKSQPRPVPETPSGPAQGATPLMAVPLIRTSMNEVFTVKPDSPSLNQGTGAAMSSSNPQHQMHSMGNQFQSVGWPTSQAMPESRHTDINISLPGG